ncbi:MAG: aminomethyltransferase [Gaiellales bacterium]|nr:aminomethyltransferase [Gaiellales bacterium]
MPDELQRTPLYGRHAELGGRLVPFAGWEMPVQYGGVIDEVRAVRTAAGVFDVSHMGQVQVGGSAAHAFLQGVLSNDLDRLSPGEAQYTLLTNERGGIVDDLIAYRREDGYLLVVNAGNRAIDMTHLAERCPEGATLVDESDGHGMLALQGPAALALLAPLCEGIDPLSSAAFTFAEARVAGVPCTVARTGYTGEPGAELICPASELVALWDALVEAGAVPCGLGARDALRLEVCYPLHGNDITQDTNAIEAGLGWVCATGKSYVGSDILARTRDDGPQRRLVALRMDEERAVPRPGCPILDTGAVVGEVTSGTFSPTLERGIGLGYVPAGLAAPDTPIAVDVRGRTRTAHIARKPLYASRSN